MSTAIIKSIGKRRKIDVKAQKLIHYFRMESALPVENKLLGDNLAQWAHNTWAYKTWSGKTRDQIKAYSENLLIKRVLAEEMKKDAKQLLHALRCNPYAGIITDLLQQLIEEDRNSLFVFCFGRELARKERGSLVHHGLLNSIATKPETCGTIEQIRSAVDDPPKDVKQVWMERGWLREQALRQLPEKAKEVVNFDFNKHIIQPSPDTPANNWRNHQDPGHTRAAPPAGEIKARWFIRRQWAQLEDSVNWEILRLTQAARASSIPKDELWARQNRIELAIRNVIRENPNHPDLPSFREYVEHYRPLLRSNMAFLITHHPRLSQMVCDVIEIMMIREVDAFAFLVASVNLSVLREDDTPVREILNDMMHPKPKVYTRPQDIIRRLHQDDIFIPRQDGKKAPVVTLPSKTAGGPELKSLAIAHPRHRITG